MDCLFSGHAHRHQHGSSTPCHEVSHLLTQLNASDNISIPFKCISHLSKITYEMFSGFGETLTSKSQPDDDILGVFVDHSVPSQTDIGICEYEVVKIMDKLTDQNEQTNVFYSKHPFEENKQWKVKSIARLPINYKIAIINITLVSTTKVELKEHGKVRVIGVKKITHFKDLSGEEFDIYYIALSNNKITKSVVHSKKFFNKTTDFLCDFNGIRQMEMLRNGRLIVRDNNFLYNLANQRCQTYKTCRECIEAQDPHCAWNITDSICISIENYEKQNASMIIQDVLHGNAEKSCDFSPFVNGFCKKQIDELKLRVINATAHYEGCLKTVQGMEEKVNESHEMLKNLSSKKILHHGPIAVHGNWKF
uniref:PSI domain-containing protein n=1 Tax=Acrobeloides nanus TaxID=290746 RepID=A0A914DRF6_9BILA